MDESKYFLNKRATAAEAGYSIFGLEGGRLSFNYECPGSNGTWFTFKSETLVLLLFATVIPNFPAWHLAGFLGSTLWLIWLLVIGIRLLKVDIAWLVHQ